MVGKRENPTIQKSFAVSNLKKNILPYKNCAMKCMVYCVVTGVTCLMMGGSDFYSLSPFERSAFEGVPGIPAEQLYKMAGKTEKRN